jgi:hypothetical protein
MTDDQILMGAIPASREYVLPEDDKKYEGFTLPRNMSRDQEKMWKAAIDERVAGRSQREFERGAGDRAESTYDATETFSAAAGAIPTPPSQIAAAGADAAIAGMDFQRGDYVGAAMSGASVLLPFVSAGMLKKLRMGGEMAAESLSKPAREAADQLNTLEADIASGRISKADAKVRGAEIEDQYLSNELAEAVDADDFNKSSSILSGTFLDKATDYISPREMESIEEFMKGSEIDVSKMSKSELLNIRNSKQFQDFELEDVRRSNEFAEAIDAEDFNKARTMLRGGRPPGGKVASFKADQAAQQAYFKSKGLGIYAPEKSSPKFGLADQGHHNVVEDLGPLLPEDRDLLGQFAGKYDLSETELRQLRDEYVAYGYDDFPGRSARGFKEIEMPDPFGPALKAAKPAKQKYMLLDPRTDQYVRTKSGKYKEFNSPDEASEYADEVLDDMTLGIRDLDGEIPDGWR